MAKLEYAGQTLSDEKKIAGLLEKCGLRYESWGLREGADVSNADSVLAAYGPEIERLKKERGYVTADVVALDSSLPNLDAICQKFDKEHHHTDDEVRFVVDGQGVFELDDGDGQFMKLTTSPGDLIVIPAMRRHLFYLTDQRRIRCIRLFRDQQGWDAIYDKAE